MPPPDHGGKRRSGAINQLQVLEVGISHHGQGACCELLMNVYVCVCVCVFNVQYSKERNKFVKGPLLSLSQDRDAEVSGLHESTVKRLRTRVGHPCTDTHAGTDNESNTPTYTDLSAVAALDPDSYTPSQHVAEFL